MKLIILASLFISAVCLADDSKYVPMCMETNKTKCVEIPNNIVYGGTGFATLGNVGQTLYSAGYMRRFQTMARESLYIGLEVNGTDKMGVYGGQIKIGAGF